MCLGKESYIFLTLIDNRLFVLWKLFRIVYLLPTNKNMNMFPNFYKSVFNNASANHSMLKVRLNNFGVDFKD